MADNLRNAFRSKEARAAHQTALGSSFSMRAYVQFPDHGETKMGKTCSRVETAFRILWIGATVLSITANNKPAVILCACVLGVYILGKLLDREYRKFEREKLESEAREREAQNPAPEEDPSDNGIRPSYIGFYISDANSECSSTFPTRECTINDRCPGNHALLPNNNWAGKEGFICIVCGLDVGSDPGLLSCRECNWDICHPCNTRRARDLD